jgi:MFS family permease
MTAMTFAMGGIGFWMPYYLEKLPNAPAQATAIFGLVTVAAGLSATLLGGWAGDRLRARFPSSYFMVSAISMLVGFPVFLMALHSGYPWVWVLIFMACFCLFFSTGPTNAILANVTHPATRAEGFALNIFFIHIFGDVISPVIIGMLSDMFSIRVGFLAVGFMFLASGIFWLFGMPHLARDMELASTRIRTDVES